MTREIERNLCDSCTNKGCILQYGIVRSHCDFYKSKEAKRYEELCEDVKMAIKALGQELKYVEVIE